MQKTFYKYIKKNDLYIQTILNFNNILKVIIISLLFFIYVIR